MNNLAQIPLASGSGFTIPGILGNAGDYADSNTTAIRLETVISTIIGVMTAIAFIWFVFLLFMGAIQYLTSGGDAKGIEAATAKIRTALIGLVIVISAIFLASLVGIIFGIPILTPSVIFLNLIS